MKKLFVITILALAPFIVGWTVSWDPVTTYTDGSTISDDNVVYDGWDNAQQIANGITGTSATFTAKKGETHGLTVRARLVRQGTVSDNSFLSWTSPVGKAGAPGQLRVAP
jgi:hypothetical protein